MYRIQSKSIKMCEHPKPVMSYKMLNIKDI